MIEDLLVLARSDAGANDQRVEPVDLDDIVLEEMCASTGSTVIVDKRRVSAAQVTGDRDELRRVVRNLLDNAHRHATTTVTVELTENAGRASLIVVDDGPGIPPERRAQVFERPASTKPDRAAAGQDSAWPSWPTSSLATAVPSPSTTRPNGGARFVGRSQWPDSMIMTSLRQFGVLVSNVSPAANGVDGESAEPHILYDSAAGLYNCTMASMSISAARDNLPAALELARTEAVYLERYGRRAAVLVSPERYEALMAALEDTEDVAAFDAAMDEEGPNIPWEQAKVDLGWV